MMGHTLAIILAAACLKRLNSGMECHIRIISVLSTISLPAVEETKGALAIENEYKR